MRDLPSGTVTMLFTDVEGSTALVQELGAEAYVRAFEMHRRLLREAVDEQGGVEVEMQGDSFHFAFHDAQRAAVAALAAQRALAGYSWEDEPIKVRMGLHTAEPVVSAGHYAGVDVHRAARVMQAGHGGQILVSEATALVLKEEQELRDLGEHRLKDLYTPERLYQLGAGTFPPLNTLESHATNLPTQPTPLVGRERELAGVLELIRRDDVRVLTLTGPGGTGKTRLVLQAAAEVVSDFAHGVWFVDLAPIADPALVVPTIAQTLGLTEEAGEAIERTLAQHLRDRRLLLVLDNFEQVVDAAADLSSLLAQSSSLKVVVTSRASLRLRGESEYAVPPLDEESALTLFEERARAVKTNFSLSGNRTVVVEICRRLDCLPLAIELAAVWVRVLAEEALLERLDQRLKLLTRGSSDLDVRQQTLRATIEWSYKLLDSAEQALYRRLAVFSGGATTDAIEAVCLADAELDVLNGVESLVDKSVLRRDDQAKEPRFAMLETIHEFAREKLDESGELERLAAAHADYYLSLAMCSRERMRTEPESAQMWLARMAHEQDNLRAALDYAAARADPDLELGLIAALGAHFWESTATIAEGRRRADSALARAPKANDLLRAHALNTAAILRHLQGDMDGTREAAEDALPVAHALGDLDLLARLLDTLGSVALHEGDSARAAALSDQALGYARQGGAADTEAGLTVNSGNRLLYEGDYAAAKALFERARAIFEALGDRGGAALAAVNAALAALHDGSAHEAAAYARDALSACPQNALVEISVCLETLAAAVAATGEDPAFAARLFGAAAGGWEELQIPLQPFERAMHERTQATLQAALGEEHFQQEFEAGKQTAVDEARRQALTGATVSGP